MKDNSYSLEKSSFGRAFQAYQTKTSKNEKKKKKIWFLHAA